MFSGKKVGDLRGSREAQDARDHEYRQEYEYRVLALMGATNAEAQLNDHAGRGWELVNGEMAGTAHYLYLRRKTSGGA